METNDPMDKSSLYIRKLIALIIVSSAVWVSYRFIPFQYLLPPALIILSVLITRITGVKPSFLFSLGAADKFLTSKGGWWILFKWILNLSGLIYDLIALTLDGVYQVFIVFIDILYLIKIIVFRIVYALIWFLKLFVPPVYFLYSNFIHYLIKWPWWIYQLAFRNAGISVNRNFYYVSWRGACLAIFIFLLFYGTGLLLAIPPLGIPGLIFATLPVIWAFGSIAHMRHNNLSEAEPEQTVAARNSGIESMKAMVFYLSLILIFLITEIILNLSGWIPAAGFSMLGIALNLNTLLSLLLLFIIVILAFANLMLPSHVVVHKRTSQGFDESVFFLGIIGKKFLRYMISLIPAAVFSFFLVIIPSVIVSLGIFLTITVRDNIIDTRIDILKEKSVLSSPSEKPAINKNIRLLNIYKSYPQNIIKEFSGIKELSIRSDHLKKNLQKAGEDIIRMEEEYNWVTDSLKNVASMTASSDPGRLQELEIKRIEAVLDTKKASFDSWKILKNEQIAEINAEISLTRSLLVQLPVIFLLTSVWLALFGGLILAVLLSYLANLFYDLFVFREDGRVSHFTHITREIQKKDHKQPLLGFTLLFITIGILIVIVFLSSQ